MAANCILVDQEGIEKNLIDNIPFVINLNDQDNKNISKEHSWWFLYFFNFNIILIYNKISYMISYNYICNHANNGVC